jgi:hypothetical protein
MRIKPVEEDVFFLQKTISDLREEVEQLSALQEKFPKARRIKFINHAPLEKLYEDGLLAVRIQAARNATIGRAAP